MFRHDDKSIDDATVLIRGIRPEWIVPDGPGERIISGTFVDGREEASCFIAHEVGGVTGFCETVLPEMIRESGVEIRMALLTAAVVRANGLWIYRKPDEFKDNSAHVVICPADGMTRSQYKKRASRLAAVARLLEAV